MKNIHVVPTDKPSRLFTANQKLIFDNENRATECIAAQHIHITSDQEIKGGEWVIENITDKRPPYIGKTFYPKNDGTVTEEILKRDLLSVNYKGHYETLAHKNNCKKIILTTDQELIADGVQAIPDEFLEWFVKNPSCEKVEVEIWTDYRLENNKEVPFKNYKIIIPQEEQEQFVECKCTNSLQAENCIRNCGHGKEPKQETLEEVAENRYVQGVYVINGIDICEASRECFIAGAKWQKERMYSEEEVKYIVQEALESALVTVDLEQWFTQFKKK